MKVTGYISSLINTGSTRHWGRYKELERWKTNFELKKILDIGCGHDPFWDATHTIDKFPTDETERGHRLKTRSTIFKEASVEAIPYDDKFFDFSYARHILEHSDDPEKACKEVIRVSKRGYIEVPEPILEYGYGYPNIDAAKRGWHFHKWLTYVDKENTLVFIKKTDETINHFSNCLWGRFMEKVYKYHQKNMNSFFNKLAPSLKWHSLLWEKDFNFKVYSKWPENIC